MAGPSFWHTFEETTNTFFTGPPPPPLPLPNPQPHTHTRRYASSARAHPYPRPTQPHHNLPTYTTPEQANQQLASLRSDLSSANADLVRANAQVASLETALAKTKYELHLEKEETTKLQDAFAAERYQKMVRMEKQLERQAQYKAIAEAVGDIDEGEARVGVLEVVYALMEEDRGV